MDVEVSEPSDIAGENVKCFSHVKNSLAVHKTLDIELPYDLVIPLQGTYPKKLKTCTQKMHAYA